MKPALKENAITLRKKGFSYSEVLKQIPVAKSTLSLWLRSVGLSKKQEQRLTEKKLAAMKRGWLKIQQTRFEKSRKIKNDARQEVEKLIKNPFWLTGVILYWTEGSKEKIWRSGERVALTNMDAEMIKLFIRWLKKYCGVKNENFDYALYIHKGANKKFIKSFWARQLRIQPIKIKIYLKSNYGKGFRKNTGDYYKGIFRARVLGSVDLNRKIAGWINGVIDYFR